MKTFVLSSALALAFLVPGVSEAAGAGPLAPQAQPATRAAPKPNASTAIRPLVAGRNVVLCYTCGTFFPNHVATGALGGFNNVWEFGNGCAGVTTNTLSYRSDANPYLCSN